MSKKTERRQLAGGTNQPVTPHVGIVYLVGDKLWIDATPLTEAGRFVDFAIHERDHISYWDELVKSGSVPSSEYEEFPRGRVSCDTKTGRFTLLADRCILGRKNLVRKILARMNLPVRGTKIDRDSHYRCYRCLGRNR
jgi:hypothetical protein